MNVQSDDKKRLHERVDRDFRWRESNNDITDWKVEQIAKEVRSAAHAIVAQAPESREASLALTHLETAFFFALAAVVRSTENPEDG